MAGHEDTIDWERIRVLLTAMTHAFAAPVVFKSFLVGWHAERMCRELTRTCVVQIRRDPADTARSLYGMRKNYGGSIDSWTSLKPREYEWLKDEPVWDQLVGLDVRSQIRQGAARRRSTQLQMTSDPETRS
jgi:hypothetical protein